MTERALADRCPGVLRPYVSADGAMVRVHVPGGRVSIEALRQLLAVAEDHGAPFVQVTSRGNLQVRALPDPVPGDVVERLSAAGFLAYPTHERVRNIVASPTSTFDALVEQLDAALVADKDLSGLSGRWLFVLADTDGVGLETPWDIAFIGEPGVGGRVLVGDRQIDVDSDAIVPTMISLARRFLAVKTDPKQWNVEDLPADSALFAELAVADAVPRASLPVGAVGDDAVLGLPLGQLARPQLQVLAQHTDHVVVTPWRSVVVPGAASKLGTFVSAQFITSTRSTWARISACPGAPYCARTSSPTLELAARAAYDFEADGPRLHIAGCDRVCGQPSGEHLSIINPTDFDDLRRQGAK